MGGEEPSKRFVRTFHTDAEALSKGGIPDFTPVDAPPEKEVVENVVVQNSNEIDLNKASTGSSLLTKPAPRPITAPPPPPPPAPPPPPPAPKKEEPKLAPLHTFTTDFADRIKETNASTASVLAAEQDAAPSAPKPEKRERGSLFVILAGILLIVLGAGGAYGAYIYLQTPGQIPLVPTAASPIFVNERELLSGSGSTLLESIATSVQKSLGANAVRLLYIENASSTTNVFQQLTLGAPPVLLRNINDEADMAGVINTGNESSPFFILSVDSYGDTFAGMLAWEPRMATDLALLYPIATTGTTTSRALFRDEVVANHDVRVLKDAAQQTVLLYGYWSPAVLVIAKDETAFAALMDRLATSRTSQ